jgi:MYXO-CTERM domain-containing protein
MRASIPISMLFLFVPGAASASSPGICDDDIVTFTQETVGVGCPIYAINPTVGGADLTIKVNQGPTMSAPPSQTSSIPLTITSDRCNTDTCELEPTTEPRDGTLLQLDTTNLRAGDELVVEGTTDTGITTARIIVTDEACAPAPSALTIATCSYGCDFVEACDSALGCSARPARASSGAWIFGLALLGLLGVGRRRTGS